jgi:hypothetical protein
MPAILWRVAVVAVVLGTAAPAWAQPPQDAPSAAADAPSWSASLSAATYFLPDDDNYVQPTVAADRGALHLESRYNYEDRNSLSGFVGWNLSAGKKVVLTVTPMFGVVGGDTSGVIPAFELSLEFGRLEIYSENEYVIATTERSSNYLYNWSEVSLRAADWLRAGIVTQRTRTLRLPPELEREVERGFLAGVTIWKIDGDFYFFNPGSDDAYLVFSIGVSF